MAMQGTGHTFAHTPQPLQKSESPTTATHVPSASRTFAMVPSGQYI